MFGRGEDAKRKRKRKRLVDIPIASPGLTISRTIPIVLEVRRGEWGVFAICQPNLSQDCRFNDFPRGL